jgi:methionine sulfoxide reductase heme-binding subunit
VAAAKRPPHPWLKPAVFVGCSFPAAQLLWRLWRKDLGANFIEESLNQLGLLALVLLVLSLCCTPLKHVLGWTWPMRLRRMLGLFAFFYASVHVSEYIVVDQQLDWATLLEDVLKRKFILVGLLAFLTMLPLAVTSTQGWVKRLGYARWSRLHQLVYASVLFACVHFVWRVKSDLTEPLVYFTAVGVLLAMRAFWAGKKRWLRTAHSKPA